MLRRLSVLAFVAAAAITLGVWIGFLFAPAPGVETREQLSEIFDEHDDTIDDLYSRGREVVDEVVDEAVESVESTFGSGETPPPGPSPDER